MTRSRLLFLLSLVCTTVLAVGPSTMPYQGFLTDSAGIPVNTTTPMQFEIFDAEVDGNSLWQESHGSVAIVQGIFDVQLGSITPFPTELFDGRLFLGISVAGDAEMVPRVEIGSVPFSFTAGRVSACGIGITNCGGICVDLQGDESNCGVCENQCGLDESCVTGLCLVSCNSDVDCVSGSGVCDNGYCLPSCSSDLDCAAGESCVGGTCLDFCEDGIQNGLETDVDCGGANSCPRCNLGENCNSDSDCLSATCNLSVLTCEL